MRASALLALAALAASSLLACADDDPPVKAVGSVDSNGSCLERPDVLPRPPQGRLPCELLPPGFGR